ncbi:toxin co-regulated pilus biosynthesis Q family protein [Paraburkholderia tropica]|uniref:Toxin co-regulated pilus biosynthesis protein Q n=1 Tax=Paraburkholderia tropica TaxID=92647 RepID=A0AAQ1GML2_9BURK|nr:toxin co-regulated pilus biosynthesis Q family protein [Paraburkholderia tropica]RQN37294.1 pilus assembly protein [Paraburkholderia tropica]SEK12930.1 Toxin co-regulated pilus biosynthesis protein Q [Paraburkholderia tropica]
MRKISILASSLLALYCANAAAAVEADQSKVHAPAGDGWQVLSPASLAASSPAANTDPASGTPAATAVPATPTASTAVTSGQLAASPLGAASIDVKPVVLPGTATGEPAGTITFSITPMSMNLRNALDAWLQTLGWQLAWKIDDDLPVEFNATFTGDFRSVLTQVMEATNHMRTPARVCEHTNNVIRVIARAANCKD